MFQDSINFETTRRFNREPFYINYNQYFNVSNPQRSRFSLSAKNGGLGILNPVAKATEQFEMSKKTSLILDSNLRGMKFDVDAYKTHVRSSKQNLMHSIDTFNTYTVKFINTYNGSLEQACTSQRKKMEFNFKTGKCQRERERERPLD